MKNENVSLLSKLNDLCEGNTALKNKIVLVEKQKEVALNENTSLKRKIVKKEKENVSKKNKKNDSHHALHANTNEMKFLKNKINCLSSTLNKRAFNHTRLESLFSKKQTPHIHAHHYHAFAYVARHDYKHTHKHSKVYKCTHCGRKRPFSKILF